LAYERAKKCLLRNNYFKEYCEDSKLFKVCEDGYFPDEKVDAHIQIIVKFQTMENALNTKIIFC